MAGAGRRSWKCIYTSYFGDVPFHGGGQLGGEVDGFGLPGDGVVDEAVGLDAQQAQIVEVESKLVEVGLFQVGGFFDLVDDYGLPSFDEVKAYGPGQHKVSSAALVVLLVDETG